MYSALYEESSVITNFPRYINLNSNFQEFQQVYRPVLQKNRATKIYQYNGVKKLSEIKTVRIQRPKWGLEKAIVLLNENYATYQKKSINISSNNILTSELTEEIDTSDKQLLTNVYKALVDKEIQVCLSYINNIRKKLNGKCTSQMTFKKHYISTLATIKERLNKLDTKYFKNSEYQSNNVETIFHNKLYSNTSTNTSCLEIKPQVDCVNLNKHQLPQKCSLKEDIGHCNLEEQTNKNNASDQFKDSASEKTSSQSELFINKKVTKLSLLPKKTHFLSKTEAIANDCQNADTTNVLTKPNKNLLSLTSLRTNTTISLSHTQSKSQSSIVSTMKKFIHSNGSNSVPTNTEIVTVNAETETDFTNNPVCSKSSKCLSSISVTNDNPKYESLQKPNVVVNLSQADPSETSKCDERKSSVCNSPLLETVLRTNSKEKFESNMINVKNEDNYKGSCTFEDKKIVNFDPNNVILSKKFNKAQLFALSEYKIPQTDSNAFKYKVKENHSITSSAADTLPSNLFSTSSSSINDVIHLPRPQFNISDTNFLSSSTDTMKSKCNFHKQTPYTSDNNFASSVFSTIEELYVNKNNLSDVSMPGFNSFSEFLTDNDTFHLSKHLTSLNRDISRFFEQVFDKDLVTYESNKKGNHKKRKVKFSNVPSGIQDSKRNANKNNNKKPLKTFKPPKIFTEVDTYSSRKSQRSPLENKNNSSITRFINNLLSMMKSSRYGKSRRRI